MDSVRIRRPIAVAASASAVILYFALSFLFFPGYFQSAISPKHPAPEVTSVSVSPQGAAVVGRPVNITVVATNIGDDADVQTVSVAFPNVTNARQVTVVSQDFLQKPIFISKGSVVGARYSAGEQTVAARYAAIEAQSWPWEHGKSYRIDLSFLPQAAGNFTILIKSVAIPHNGNTSHYPQGGILDQQGEYAQAYVVPVKNS